VEHHRPPAGRIAHGFSNSDTVQAEFKAAWEALKSRMTPEQFAMAYKAMNFTDDG
jgi:hypothetical protein